MRGIQSISSYVPYWAIDRQRIAEFYGGRGKGRRSVASFDEDPVTLAVAASRHAVGSSVDAIESITFVTSQPIYLEKSSGTTVGAALRTGSDVAVLDAVGAVRSGATSIVGAYRSTATTLVAIGDIRTGMANSPDELNGGDAGAAVVVADGDETSLAAVITATASCSVEFVDRWRVPGEVRTKQWEERFGETQYVAAGVDAVGAALTKAGISAHEVHVVACASANQRATAQVLKKCGIAARLVDLSDGIGNAGAAQFAVALSAAIESSEPGETVLGLSLWDGADAMVLTVGRRAANGPSVQRQLEAAHGDVSYSKFLSWRKVLPPQPPNRPEPARQSASAAARNADWKFGFVGSQDSQGNVNMPPARVSLATGEIDHMTPIPMADAVGTVVTFTIDRLAYSPSPPVIFAVVDFADGGRLPVELCDCSPEDVAVGSTVKMAFRRINESDGIVNYFWKASLVR